MLFNSFEFLIFFPLVTLLYFLLPHALRWLLLLSASCYFYMAFVPSYILILAVTIVVDYLAGLLIEPAAGLKRKLLLVASIVSNLGFLFFFKYFNFVNGNLRDLADLLDWNYPIPALEILLPIGLSFHTFQALSYTIEVYRGQQPAERHFGIYALYVLFYPQLVAGPIERPQNLLPQFGTPHTFDHDRVVEGLRRMLWGMFKKIVIADRLALYVNAVFNSPEQYNGLPILVATVFFAFQIYCDFSGYCDIALGAAQVMGFRLMENFDRPYFATSLSDFWRRWHISLSFWFRDYVYIPLGGNRMGVERWYGNLLLVFVLSGFWHGANWTFLVWGGLHGLYLVGSIVTAHWREQLVVASGLHRHPRFLHSFRIAVTFTLVCFAWIFFRANNLADAVLLLENLFRSSWRLHSVFVLAPTEVYWSCFLIGLLVTSEFLQNTRPITAFLAPRSVLLRWTAYVSLTVMILYLGKYNVQDFIYFQF